jgi:hypothetical protein
MRFILPTLLFACFLIACQSSDKSVSQAPAVQLTASDAAVLQLGGLQYQAYDEAGLTPRAITLARMIASTDYCRRQVRAAGRTAGTSGLTLGFDSGPEMGTDAPTLVYRFRLYRECIDMDQTHDWFFFDPASESLYVEDLVDGNHRRLEVAPALLADYRADRAAASEVIGLLSR